MKSFEQMNSSSPDVLCLVPAGGYGTRLETLTADRAKPGLAIAFDKEGAVQRMIDVPLKAIQQIGGRAIVTTFFAPETLQFVDRYLHVAIQEEKVAQSPMDTLFDAQSWLKQSGIKTIGIVPGDAFVSREQLQDLHDTLLGTQADAVILATKQLAGHNVRSIDRRGLMTSKEEGVDQVADLGIHFFKADWLLSRLAERPGVNIDVWTDIYNADKPEGDIMLHVPQQDGGWVDMGTPLAFFRTVVTLNRSMSDRNGNIIFPGASLHGAASQTIALPNSSSAHPHNYAILPEGIQVLDPRQAVTIGQSV